MEKNNGLDVSNKAMTTTENRQRVDFRKINSGTLETKKNGRLNYIQGISPTVGYLQCNLLLFKLKDKVYNERCVLP